MSYTLNGVALVTGASRGIGRAIAERLASAGMKVAVAARTEDEIEAVAQAIGGKAVVPDVTDQAGVAKAVESVEQDLGAIDLLVNNAGILGSAGPAWERDAAEWWHILALGHVMCTEDE